MLSERSFAKYCYKKYSTWNLLGSKDRCHISFEHDTDLTYLVLLLPALSLVLIFWSDLFGWQNTTKSLKNTRSLANFLSKWNEELSTSFRTYYYTASRNRLVEKCRRCRNTWSMMHQKSKDKNAKHYNVLQKRLQKALYYQFCFCWCAPLVQVLISSEKITNNSWINLN